MSSPVTKPRIFITAIDNKGVKHTLRPLAWSKITGKSVRTIQDHYHAMKAGEDINCKQVVGFEDMNHRGRAKQKAARKHRLLTVKEQMMSEFLSKRLVGV